MILTQAEFNKLNNWYKLFNKADRIRTLAWELQYIVPHKMLDNRTTFAWNKVKQAELFETFINGKLTPKARYVWIHMKLHKLTGATIKIK